jgi:hypothetical protein
MTDNRRRILETLWWEKEEETADSHNPTRERNIATEEYTRDYKG